MPFDTVAIATPTPNLVVDDPALTVAARVATGFDPLSVEVRVDGVDLIDALGLVPPFSGVSGTVSIGGNPVQVSGGYAYDTSVAGNPKPVDAVLSGLAEGAHQLEVSGVRISNAQLVADLHPFVISSPLGLALGVVPASANRSGPVAAGRHARLRHPRRLARRAAGAALGRRRAPRGLRPAAKGRHRGRAVTAAPPAWSPSSRSSRHRSRHPRPRRLRRRPTTIPYQGLLLDSGGAPQSGTVDLTLRVYDALTGGSLVYKQVFSGVPLTRRRLQREPRPDRRRHRLAREPAYHEPLRGGRGDLAGDGAFALPRGHRAAPRARSRARRS